MKRYYITITDEDYSGDPIQQITLPSINIKITIDGKTQGFPIICSDENPLDNIPNYIKEVINLIKEEVKL